RILCHQVRPGRADRGFADGAAWRARPHRPGAARRRRDPDGRRGGGRPRVRRSVAQRAQHATVVGGVGSVRGGSLRAGGGLGASGSRHAREAGGAGARSRRQPRPLGHACDPLDRREPEARRAALSRFPRESLRDMPPRRERRSMERSTRVQGAIDVLTAALAGGLTTVERMHRAIAEKPFSVLRLAPAVREVSEAVRALHDGIADITYGTIGASIALAGGAARLATAVTISDDAEPPPGSLRGLAIAALNGFAGERLAGAGNPLASDMTLRHAGRVVPIDREALG